MPFTDTRFRATSLLPVVLGSLVLVGCSSSSEVSVSKEKLATTIADKLEQQVGEKPDRVDCPDDLPGKVGKSVTCELAAQDGSTVGVTATVTSVEGGSVKFDIQVDTDVTPAPTR